jgi:cell division protein FtsI/penicillin-binding protein 2
VLAAAAFTVGLIVGSGGDDGRDAVSAYARAWTAGDWAAMHAQLTPAAQARIGLLPFAAAERSALATATANERSVTTGEPKDLGNDRWRVPVTVRTRIFGTIKGAVVIPVAQDGGSRRVDWKPRLVFPELRDGERLTRRTVMPDRGTLTARDGTPLAQGPNRASPIPDVAGQVVGKLGPISDVEAQRVSQLGVPPTAKVGTGGLERVFDDRLGGLPSGALLAGTRVIARARGRAGDRVRTTIDPALERVAVTALAGRYGGAVAFDPRSGAVLAYAGAPFSLLQPPGSTFKVITTAGALEAGVTKITSTFPYESQAVLSGVPLSNAGGEVCGGTLVQAFAVSCNSVFAPLGAKLGAQRLVQTAEAFGFNRPPAFPIVAQSTIPQADAIGDDLAVGSSAIGQGQVQATALQMAEAAGVIANRGRRRPLTLDLAQARQARPGTGERVISARTARRMQRLMLAVVANGTGTAAQIPGVQVAGKTGTAELKSRDPGDTSTNPQDTDAWFVAYAPAAPGRTPRIAVGVLLVGAGAGGDSAAPVAHDILVAGLQRG